MSAILTSLNRTLLKAAVLATSTTALLSICLPPLLAASPSLSDGIMCIAKGKKGQDRNVYFYTSAIDDATFSKKQSVSVTMLEKQVEVDEADLVVLDKDKQDLTVTGIETVTESAPELEPVALAQTTLTSKDTFSGKTKTGTPVTFRLEKDYSAIELTHGGQTYSGICR